MLSKPIKAKPLNMNVHLVLIKIRINHNFAIRFTKDYMMIGRENRYLGKERFNVRDILSANKSLNGLAAEGDKFPWRCRSRWNKPVCSCHHRFHDKFMFSWNRDHWNNHKSANARNYVKSVYVRLPWRKSSYKARFVRQ